VKRRNETTWIRPCLLAGAALPGLLVLFATGGCSPSTGGAAIDQNALDQAARAIVRAEDRVAASELADLHIGDRSSVTVIDLRPRADFEAGHIEGASHAELTALLSPEGREGVADGSRLVLVSADGTHAAQAAALLRVAGVTAQALDGGYAAWRRLMEGGESGAAADAAAARAQAKRQAVACWFEGDYVAAAGLAVKQDAAPAATGGFVPPLQPATPAPAPAEDPLGLGLGTPGAAAAEDPLGLGLGVPGEASARPARKLKIREGC
jgi:rhodanese-related sulfurtransferase